MAYTYVIGKKTTSEDFKALCKRIGDLYPEYEQKGGKKYADGAENARWEKGDLVITAELEAAPAILTVTFDEELPELESECCLKDKERRERRFFYDTFLSSGARVKFLFIPVLICVWWVVFTGTELHIFGTLLNIRECFYPFFAYFGICLGWKQWLIPAGLAVIWAARFKKPVIIKLLTAALPVVSIVYGCIFYDFEGGGFFFVYLLWVYFLDVGDYLLAVFGVLSVLYIVALPYLAIDEIACRRLLKLTGKRPSKNVSVICPALSIAASAAVLVGFLIAAGLFDR